VEADIAKGNAIAKYPSDSLLGGGGTASPDVPVSPATAEPVVQGIQGSAFDPLAEAPAAGHTNLTRMHPLLEDGTPDRESIVTQGLNENTGKLQIYNTTTGQWEDKTSDRFATLDKLTSQAPQRRGDEKDTREVFTAATGGYLAGKRVLEFMNTAQVGGQDMWNQAAAWLGDSANIFRSYEEGKIDPIKVKELLKIPLSTTDAKLKAAVEAKREAMMGFSLERAFGIDLATSEEERKEIRALADVAKKDVALANMSVLMAKAYRGEGKLNTDDRQRLDALVKRANVTSTIAAVQEAQGDMYKRFANRSAQLVARQFPEIGRSRILKGNFAIAKAGDDVGTGMYYQVDAPKVGEPEIVYVPHDTGVAEGLSTAQFARIARTLNTVPNPFTINN